MRITRLHLLHMFSGIVIAVLLGIHMVHGGNTPRHGPWFLRDWYHRANFLGLNDSPGQPEYMGRLIHSSAGVCPLPRFLWTERYYTGVEPLS